MSFRITRHTADGHTEIIEHAGPNEGGSGGNIRVDLDRLRSIGFGSRTRNTVREGRRADGVRWKATTDELRTTVTEHAKGDRQDVHLRPAQVTGQITPERASWLLSQGRTSKRS